MSETTVYCTAEDVQRHVKRVQFSDETKVTLSDINAYIQSVSAIVDGELFKFGIALPVSTESKRAREVLRLLVSYEAASMAEQAANFGSNKNESSHGKWLHDQHVSLLERIQQNPCMLSDVAMSSCQRIQSSTEDMNKGEPNAGKEIFTQEKVEDFVAINKISSPSEIPFPTRGITGEIDNLRI